MFEGFANAAVAAGRAMNAIVQAPDERIEHPLNIDSFHAFSKTGEDGFTDICFAVSVGIFQTKNIGGRSNEYAAAITENRRGPRQIISEDGAFIIDAVTVGVFQHTDAAEVRAFFTTLRIIDHLDDKQPPIFIERKRNRTDDIRFTSRNFHMKAFLDLEGLERILWFVGWESRQVVGGYGGLRCPSCKSAKKEDWEEQGGQKFHISLAFLYRCQATQKFWLP